jgi:hypothetical protein
MIDIRNNEIKCPKPRRTRRPRDCVYRLGYRLDPIQLLSIRQRRRALSRYLSHKPNSIPQHGFMPQPFSAVQPSLGGWSHTCSGSCYRCVAGDQRRGLRARAASYTALRSSKQACRIYKRADLRSKRKFQLRTIYLTESSQHRQRDHRAGAGATGIGNIPRQANVRYGLWIQLVSATHARFRKRNSKCLSNRY